MKTYRPAFRAWAANANTSGFASKIPTITEPTNDGVVNVAGIGNQIPCQMKLWPIGLGSDNDAFSMRILGWTRVGSGPSPGIIWYPTILAEFVCTCSAAVGIALSPVLSTERFCDTITPVAARLTDYVIGAGTAVYSDVAILSPVNDTPAFIIMPTSGFEKLEFCFDQTTGTPTTNCLISYLD